MVGKMIHRVGERQKSRSTFPRTPPTPRAEGRMVLFSRLRRYARKAVTTCQEIRRIRLLHVPLLVRRQTALGKTGRNAPGTPGNRSALLFFLGKPILVTDLDRTMTGDADRATVRERIGMGFPFRVPAPIFPRPTIHTIGRQARVPRIYQQGNPKVRRYGTALERTSEGKRASRHLLRGNHDVIPTGPRIRPIRMRGRIRTDAHVPVIALPEENQVRLPEYSQPAFSVGFFSARTLV